MAVYLRPMDSDLRRSLLRIGLGMVAVVLLLALLGSVWRTEIAAFGRRVVDVLGYPGIFAGIQATDMLTLPIPPLAYIAVAVAASLDPLAIVGLSGAASVLAGLGAFGLGRILVRFPRAERLVAPLRRRGPDFERKMGASAMLAIAATPLPYSIVCTLAGMTHLSFRQFWPATLFRVPRMAMYWGIVWVGWTSSS